MRRSRGTAWSALAGVALVALGGSGLTSASAAPRAPVVYDALGDSYASGYGVPPYSSCGRSESAYPVQLDGRMRIHLDDFAACAGATTASLVSSGQLDALGADTDLVTISVGGNDIGWSTAITACLVSSDASCADALAASTHKVSTVLPGLLDSVYGRVAARAPRATVLVTGYPRLFSPDHGPFLLASTSEQEALNAGADLLDDVIADAAARDGFEFVDVTKRFVDHGVNAPEPWVLGPFSPGAFHPNAAGYEAYTAALTAELVPRRLG